MVFKRQRTIIFCCIDERFTDYERLKAQGASGTISSMLWVAEGLAGIGFDVIVVNSADGQYDNAKSPNGVKLVSNRELEVGKQCFLEFSTVLYVIAVGVDLDAGIIEKKSENNFKIIFWHHNPICLSDCLKRLNEHLIDRHVFVSFNHLIRHIKINFRYLFKFWRKVTVIYNPIDFDLLDSAIEYKKNKDIFKLAYVGNVSIEKGYNRYQNLASKLGDRYGNERYEWHVYGGGLYANDTSYKADSLIHHGTLGRKPLYNHMLSSDVIFAGLGNNETFCVSAVEAAYLGKFVVVGRKGGQYEAISRYKYKYSIEKIEKSNNLSKMLKATPSASKVDKFRSFSRKLYSIEHVSSCWSSFLTVGRCKIRLYHNIVGLVRSFGL